MTPLLLALATIQAPTAPASIPHQPGLTIVQAVEGDTLRGNSRGDYEAVIVVTSFAERTVTLSGSALVRSNAGRREWLHVGRTVSADDLRGARTQILGFDTSDPNQIPGTTALGPSLAVLADARRLGSTEIQVRNYANRHDNRGTLRRVGAGAEPFPVLLNGQRVSLPAIHMQGQLGAPEHLRPWVFWFLDDPVQPLTLKVSYGAEGASLSARPEWSRQIIRIDVPDGGPAPGEHIGGGGVLSADGAGAGDGPVATAGGGGGPGAAAARSAGGTGTGHGGVGMGVGGAVALARDLGAKCRVPVPGVYFEFDSDELNPASAPWIRAVADLLRLHPEWSITIEGHTDSIGGQRYNQDLSTRRAASLKRELVGHHGITDSRLDTRGFGASRPLESNASVQGRARNRRVELVRPCERRVP